MAKVCVKEGVVVKVISDIVDTPSIPEGATVIEADVEVGKDIILENGVPVETIVDVVARRAPVSI